MWYAPNVLTQIPQKKELTMTVKMELTGKEAGDFGGIGVEGHIYGYAGLYSTGEKMEIRCYRGIVTEKCSMERQKRGLCSPVNWKEMYYGFP